MALANPPVPDNINTLVPKSGAFDGAFGINGRFTGTEDTDFKLQIFSLTTGTVLNLSGHTGSHAGCTVGTYSNIQPINVVSSGTGLKITAVIEAGSPLKLTLTVSEVGSGYAFGDTVKIVGTSIGGATTANDLTITIGEVVSQNLKYRYKLINSTSNQGWLPEAGQTAIGGIGMGDEIALGIRINWGDISIFNVGDEISFKFTVNATRASEMHILSTKDGAHLLKYDNGYLKVSHNIDSYEPITTDIDRTRQVENKGIIGRLSEEEYGAVFSTINSKSVTIGLGPDKVNKPKWAGIPEHKQFDKELTLDKVVIADAELSLSSEIPQFDDMVRIDTANWYDDAGTPNKGGVGGLWTKPYYAAFQAGNPTIFLFRVKDETDFLHKEYYKYPSGITSILNPIAIATDGAHLFVLDDNSNGIIHCFKFTGGIDVSDTDSPKIIDFNKYNDTWPMVLPDTPRGICSRHNTPDEKGGGAWFSDIKVTPADCRFNDSSGGFGRIWLQASWSFDKDRDYAKYEVEGYEPDTVPVEDMWYPAICGETDENEWLWSITLTNPAHPTGMEAETGADGRLFLVNRSPSMTKFYKVTWMNKPAPNYYNHQLIIRGDYDLTDGDDPEGDETDALILNFSTPALIAGGTGGFALTDFAQPIGSLEAGIMSTFKYGLVDMDEATKIGVCLVWASSDEIKSNISEPRTFAGAHRDASSKLYAEIGTSSAYYVQDFLNQGNHFPREDSSGNELLQPKIETCAIPAGQCVTLNLIDGTAEGWSKKPLIIPLAEDCVVGGYNQSEIPADNYNQDSDWGTAVNQFERRSLIQENGKVSDFSRALYNSNTKKLFTFASDGEIKLYDLAALHAAKSLEEDDYDDSWDKDEFLRKNPFHSKNDYLYNPGSGVVGAFSNQMPGANHENPANKTGFVQHHRANRMHLAEQEKRLCYRDRGIYGYGTDRFTEEGFGDWNKNEWNDVYGGVNSATEGEIRIFLLPFELPSTRNATITHSAQAPETMWDFKATSIYIDSGETVVTNQKVPQMSYIDGTTTIQGGITPVSDTVGYKASSPSLIISGDDTEGNGVPTSADDRIGSPISPGKSRFIGWYNKDEPADGAGANALPSTANAVDYMYYAFSFMYDGYQESVLSAPIGSSVDTNSGFSVQVTGDALSIKISIPDVDSLSPRMSHICLYRSKTIEDVSSPKAFFQLVEQISLSDIRWTQLGTTRKWECTITDTGKTGDQYEIRTGMSEIIDDTQPHYGIATKGDGFLFIGQTWHSSLENKENFIFRSQQGKFNMYDWSTDWIELPEYPTALSYYGGKLFAFSKQTCWMINPMTMQIEEDILQCGCLSQQSIISCDYGMFWADRESIWLYDGSRFKNIGLPIEQGGTYSYRQRDRANSKVHVEFDAFTKTFCVFIKPKAEYVTMDNTNNSGDKQEISQQATIWAYHIEKGRWDYWVLEDLFNSQIPDHGINIGSKTLATCRDWSGGVLYANNNGLWRLGTNQESRKNWEWISKNFVMGHPTLDKRFYKVRAVSTNGNPFIQYKVDDAPLSIVVGGDEKITTKKGKRIKVKVLGPGETSVDSVGIIYRRPKAK